MPFYIGARYKNIGVAEYDKYHFCNDTFDASNDSYIFTNIEKMKLRVIFKDRLDSVFNNAVINWNKRIIEFSNGKKGFVPFEAIIEV